MIWHRETIFKKITEEQNRIKLAVHEEELGWALKYGDADTIAKVKQALGM